MHCQQWPRAQCAADCSQSPIYNGHALRDAIICLKITVCQLQRWKCAVFVHSDLDVGLRLYSLIFWPCGFTRLVMKRKWGSTPAQNPIIHMHGWWLHRVATQNTKVLLKMTCILTHNVTAFAVWSWCVFCCWHWCFNGFVHQWDPHPYPNPWPLIQTLVIWPAVAWLTERQATLHFHSFAHILSATFKPHGDPYRQQALLFATPHSNSAHHQSVGSNV